MNKTYTKGVITTCQHCGKEFRTIPAQLKRGYDKYCSVECRDAARIALRKMRVCIQCGKEFYRRSSKVQYCSPKCRALHKTSQRKPPTLITCLHCGKQTEFSSDKHFCSKECRLTHCGREETECAVCSKIFTRAIGLTSKKFCSAKCRKVAGEQNKDTVVYMYQRNRAEFVNAIHARERHVCPICGAETILIHHLDMDRRNDVPNNVIAVCHKCHVRIHRNYNYWTPLLILAVGNCTDLYEPISAHVITQLHEAYANEQIPHSYRRIREQATSEK